MKNLAVLVVSIIVLSGCETTKEVYTSDGKIGYSIKCSGTARSWSSCYEKASDICGANGYITLEKDTDQGSVITGNQYGLHGGSVVRRSMVIQCKE